jgi:hypothetical protein
VGKGGSLASQYRELKWRLFLASKFRGTKSHLNIGADKTLPATKYWRRQNIGKISATTEIKGVDKILALTKSWCRQNLGVNKKLAQTKCWRRRRRIPLLLGSAESTAADFSPTSLKISYVSLMVLLSLHAVSKCGIALATLLLWADSLPYCTSLLYRPAVLKMSQILAPIKFCADKILAPIKYQRPPKIH